MSATLVDTLVGTPEPPTTPIEFDEAELFFFTELVPYVENLHYATEEAIARAGAERLGFAAGVIFEWDDFWEGGQRWVCVEMTLDGAFIAYREFPEDDASTDALRRVIEADLVREEAGYILTIITEHEGA